MGVGKTPFFDLRLTRKIGDAGASKFVRIQVLASGMREGIAR